MSGRFYGWRVVGAAFVLAVSAGVSESLPQAKIRGSIFIIIEDFI
jgi:hypothetical protein